MSIQLWDTDDAWESDDGRFVHEDDHDKAVAEAEKRGYQVGRIAGLCEAMVGLMSAPSWSVVCPEWMPDLAEFDAVMVIRRDHVRQVMASMHSSTMKVGPA